MSTETDEMQPPEEWAPVVYTDYVEAITLALTPTLDAPHKCRRCDEDEDGTPILCNECEAVARRRDWCACGHQRTLHHNNMGCLGRMAGELCDCEEFALTWEGTP